MKIFVNIAMAALCAMMLGGAADAQSTKLRKLGTQNDALAWQSVGRLDIGRSGYCTGTLIAPDLVLTAAHCVYQNGKLVTPANMTFRAGLTNGTAAAKRVVSQIEAHVGYTPNRGYDLDNVRHDLALVRLSDPIPTHELNPFAVFSSAIPKGPVSVVSYGRGRSDALSRQNQCQVMGMRDRLIVLDCDVTFGSSGAPVFTHLNGRAQIASVISGGGTSAGKEVAFGMALPQLISDLKRQMRANKVRPGAKIRRVTVGTRKTSTGAKFVRANGS
ncbi:trypsin-like serine peptidase [Sulfitobacter geojensis]|uniref:trypsin-like serine peptidase n=1 Tax=Sulfitobacter geojensis TaxID=1342299 RepID=UPI00046A97DE|nr:trypsin-like serine protease [Sulfitobacter geojensis]KHA53857.1 Serine protease-like protein [Sulfitobacter geojensis]NYI27507.1 protease YdgD [Sulfitobacter geojensis]